jgi:hypothetical protein
VTKVLKISEPPPTFILKENQIFVFFFYLSLFLFYLRCVKYSRNLLWWANSKKLKIKPKTEMTEKRWRARLLHVNK